MGDDVVVEQLGGTELVDHGVNIDGSEEGALNVFDNLDGDTTLSYDRTVSQTVKEWEKRTVTSHRQTDVKFNLNVVGIYKGIKATMDLFVGHTTSVTELDDTGFEKEKNLTEQVKFDVLPGTKKIVHVSYRTFEYSYRFSGTAECVYLDEPNQVYPGGIAEGELLGSEALTGIVIDIDTVTKDEEEGNNGGDGVGVADDGTSDTSVVSNLEASAAVGDSKSRKIFAHVVASVAVVVVASLSWL